MITSIISSHVATFFLRGKPHSIPVEKITDAIRQALTSNDEDALLKELEPPCLAEDLPSDFEMHNGVIEYEGLPLDEYTNDRIIAFFERGLPIQPILNFIKRVRKNPSFRAVNGLYRFLEQNDLPLTPDGRFVAYKRIRGDWTDCHTGRILNTVGSEISMPRNMVDEDPTQTCSYGYHVCAFDYLKEFWATNPSSRIVAVIVDPEHVVAIPNDYNHTKMRVCKYVVSEELDREICENIWKSTPIYNAPNTEKDDEYEDEDWDIVNKDEDEDDTHND
jgi:hypothetical protein